MDLVFAMEDMERGLEEMAQSVEHMQEMLSRSPMVQALAQRKPEVRLPSALRRHQGQVILQAASSCTTCRLLADSICPKVFCEQVVFTKSEMPRTAAK